MTGILWLTNIETSEPVGVPLSKVLLIEQKRPQDGGAVAIYLDHDREVHVTESLSRVNELMAVASKGCLTSPPDTLDRAKSAALKNGILSPASLASV